jgi:hypothetical protein
VEAQRPSNIQFLPNACNINNKEKPANQMGRTSPRAVSSKVLDSPLLQAELLSYINRTEGDKAAASFIQHITQTEPGTEKAADGATRKEAKGTFFCSDLEQDLVASPEEPPKEKKAVEAPLVEPGWPLLEPSKDELTDHTVRKMMSFLEVEVDDANDLKPERPSSLAWNGTERETRPLYLRKVEMVEPESAEETTADDTIPQATPVTPFSYPAKSDNPFFPRPDTPSYDDVKGLELLKNLDIKSPPGTLSTAMPEQLYFHV